MRDISRLDATISSQLRLQRYMAARGVNGLSQVTESRTYVFQVPLALCLSVRAPRFALRRAQVRATQDSRHRLGCTIVRLGILVAQVGYR